MKLSFKLFVVLVFVLLTVGCAAKSSLPEIGTAIENAKIKTSGDKLIVTTGQVQRTWKWTGEGFVTVEIKDNISGHVWTGLNKSKADWNLGELGEGKLVSLKAFENNDEKFTSWHVAAEAEIHYAQLHLKYVIWAYPNAPGIRTQIWLKKTDSSELSEDILGPGVSETLLLKQNPKTTTAFGYKAGLKAHEKDYNILKEEAITEQKPVKWASGLVVEDSAGGIILIKESHNHVTIHNALKTGAFEYQDNMIKVTGLGIRPDDIKEGRYRFCWANWMILYRGDNNEAQLAVKKFDRVRYPINQQRDIFIMANTWGTEDKQPQCKYKAREENVLKEIEVCSKLGIDLLQIDDGWQNRNWRPRASARDKFILHNGTKFEGEYDLYPNGFGKVRDKAKEMGIKLGLWHAWKAPTKSIKANYDEGDFKAFKLDFAHLGKKDDLDYLYYKARDLIKHSDYTAVVNWDVTERAPRMGYYFGRDCGNLYLSNRKAFTIRPAVQYDPWQVLHDAWQLAKYTNLNKIQISYQNKDLTPSNAVTDALKYTHSYNIAITLMSSPILFTETQFIPPKGQAELKKIFDIYKAERKTMYHGYVFAIGDKPDNSSWTGLQNYDPYTQNGYLTIFRELKNKQANATIALNFYKPGTKLELTDLLSGKTRIVSLDNKSRVEFYIPQAPGFRYLKVTKIK